MNTKIKLFCLFIISAIIVISGCEPSKKTELNKELIKPDPKMFETTLSEMASINQVMTFNLEAYGLVGGLNGTGSSECEPNVRNKLIKQIQKELNTTKTTEANKLINSMDTAVVYVRGVVPALALTGETFDIQVFPLPGTQTTSLEGGRLYSIDLTPNANVNYATAIAYARGPIFVNKVDGGKGIASGYYVLGGGKVIDNAPLALWLNEPNYSTSNAIRNRINERFGMETAKAVSPSEIILHFPNNYLNNKIKFISMLEQLYLGTDERLTQQRIDTLSQKLLNGAKKGEAEIALETIGKSCIKTIAPFLQSDDPAVRFFTSRCMMNLGDARGFRVLEEIAHTNDSEYRMAAIEAIGTSALKEDAIRALEILVNDPDYDIMFEAYSYLRKLKSFAITQKTVAGDFIVENVMSQGQDIIYVSRSNVPKIVIFGAPIRCYSDVFAKSADGSIVVTAQEGDDFISLMRQHPTKPGLIGPIKSSYEVSDMVRTLGELTVLPEGSKTRPGLAVPYSEIIKILEDMCSQKMIDAKFVAGQMADVRPLTATEGN